MSSGYYFSIALIILLILLLTDWKPIIAPRFSSKLMVISVLTLTLLSFNPQRINLSPVIPLLITAPTLYVVIIALAIIICQMWRFKQWFHLLLAIVVMTICYVFMKHLYLIDPVNYWISPIIDAALLVACINVVLIRRAVEQFAIATVVLAVGHMMLILLHPAMLPIVVGSLDWWDEYGISLLSVATLRVMIYYFMKCKLHLAHIWTTYRRGGST